MKLFKDHAVAALNDVNDVELVTELNNNLISALNSAAESTIPAKVKTCVRETWCEDNEFNALLEERKNHIVGSEYYKSATKRIKKHIRKLRNEKLSREAENINLHNNERQIEELYRSFKDDNSSFQNVKTNTKCDPAKITEHFQKHFKPLRTDEPALELQQAASQGLS